MRLAYAALLLAACSGDVPELVYGLDDSDYWQDTRGYPGVGDGRLIVTNNLDDTLSVLDLALVGTPQLAELARVPVGLIPVEREGPHHLAAAPDGAHYYVGISNYVPAAGSGPHGVHGAGTADGYVLKLRASDNVEVANVRVDRNPGDVRLTPDGATLLVSHFDLLRITEALEHGAGPEAMDTNLAFVDPATMTRRALVPLCPAAHGIAIAPDSSRAFVTCLSDELAVVDLATTTVTRIPVVEPPGDPVDPHCYPYAATMMPAGDGVWVSCFASGELRRYDVASGAMDTTRVVRLAGGPMFAAARADGTRLYVPTQANDTLATVDPATGAVLDTLPLPPSACISPHVARLSPDETRLLLVCEGNHRDPGTLAVIELAGGTIEHTVALGLYPDDLELVRSAP